MLLCRLLLLTLILVITKGLYLCRSNQNPEDHRGDIIKVFRSVASSYDLPSASDLTEAEKDSLFKSLSPENFGRARASAAGNTLKVTSLNGVDRRISDFPKLQQQGAVGDLVGLNGSDR